MFNFKTLRCYHCDCVILNLPEVEVNKLNGLNFMCECCGHQNILTGFNFSQGPNNDPFLNIYSIESIPGT